MAEDLEQQVRLSQQGNRRAFEQLVGIFQKQVFFTVLRVVQDRHMADDVTQEVFIKAYRALPALQEPAYFKTWLLRIAMNRAIDQQRRSSREREQVFFFEEEPAGAGTECESLDRAPLAELGTALQEALASLPQKLRRVMALSLDGKLSHEEAGRILGCPAGTVKSRLHHARRQLREKLKRYL